ncbi:MAG: cytidylate kinase-like family protein, partial [Angelakisella sp.]
MTDNLIITISRQYGSNGRHIGMALAKELGIAFYDKELIKLAASQNGISEKMFEEADEMPSNSFLYSLSMGSRNFGTGFNYMDCLSNDKLFLMQSKVIRELADKGPCVIVGRCADYILRDHKNCINIFFHASSDFRVAHVMEELDLAEDAAKEMIRKVGKKRASYYNYYSDVEWG